MSLFKLLKKGQFPQKPVIIIAITTLIALSISVYCLYYGVFIIFQNLLYVPIIIACIYYRLKGFVFSVLLSAVYFFLMTAFGHSPVIFTQALIRLCIFVGVAGVITVLSIIMRTRLDAVLSNSENRYRFLFEHSPDGILIMDQTTARPLEFNETAHKQLGYTREEFSGLSIFDLDVDHRPESFLTCMAQVSSEGHADFETRQRTKQGEIKNFHVTARTIKIKKQDFYYCIWSDITAQKRVEESLRAGKERYRMLFRHAPIGIMHFDINGVIINFNDKYQEIMGADREKILGFNMLEKLQDQEMLKAVNDALNGKTGYYEGNYISVLGNRPNFIRAILQRITSADGKFVVAIGIFEEITERKKLEKELDDYRNHLEELVRTRTAELARSNADLEQFAYVASHDLQEPLRMVASFTQLLAKRYQGKLGADADEFISFAVDGANRMQKLINDLLAYSRVTTRKSPFVPIDCEKVLDNVINNLTLMIDESGASITHEPLPAITGNLSQIGQVFQNLIINAIKFRSNEPLRVHVSAALKDNDWIFSVSDNGIGIDSNHFERIFLIFQRLKDKKDTSGTGIGLAVCKKIVENHGGRIWVESQYGKGSTFYFSIPQRQVQ